MVLLKQSSRSSRLSYLDEKSPRQAKITSRHPNPVVGSANYALKKSNLVKISDEGVHAAARYISQKMRLESYTPRTWRTHPLHICPPDPYSPSDQLTKTTLDWIFLISSLNFSFWSEKEGSDDRYGVEWRTGWEEEEYTTHTGYWSLVAALDRALEENIPIIDPEFYSSEIRCPDSLIEHVFRPAAQSNEPIPLLKERISIMREVGTILCENHDGSFQGFVQEFQRYHRNEGTALDLVRMVTDKFPSFRDESWYKGCQAYFWKRPQILVAEVWAAFYPADPSLPHPLFPGHAGPSIENLTMFADYRVPQILHHLRILVYPPSLLESLRAGVVFPPGSREEVSLRAASIVAVERVREDINRIRNEKSEAGDAEAGGNVSSVLIDFYLWDLAKKLERGEEQIEGIETAEMVPAHRTRSIWY